MRPKYTFKHILIIFIFSWIGLTPSDSYAISYISKPLSLIDHCCTTHTTKKIQKYEKEVTPWTERSPGRGPMVMLYETPFYKQQITRKRCVARSDAKNSFCKCLCHKMQNYVKQSVIVEDGYYKKLGIRDVWVPDGCRDGAGLSVTDLEKCKKTKKVAFFG